MNTREAYAPEAGRTENPLPASSSSTATAAVGSRDRCRAPLLLVTSVEDPAAAQAATNHLYC